MQSMIFQRESALKNNQSTSEHQCLVAQHQNEENWQLWGPYLAERAWGSVREDYSADGKAWEHFTHDQSRSRAYRWNEDGLGGICDRENRILSCLAEIPTGADRSGFRPIIH